MTNKHLSPHLHTTNLLVYQQHSAMRPVQRRTGSTGALTLWYKQYVMNVLKICDIHIIFYEFVYYIL